MRPLLLIVCLSMLGQPAVASAFSHRQLDRILKKHVRHGKVDYAGIKQHDADALETYVGRLANAKIAGRNRNDQLAFYLNAYNALVISAVVRRLPDVTSVKKVKGFFDRTQHTVAGKKLTLNALENQVIRPKFKDARIHFALVCAARSCPPLRAAAFDGRTLDRILDRLTRAFINSRHGVRLEGNAIEISQLFKWYAQDFVKAAGSVGAYLARYHRTHSKRLTAQKAFRFLRYSWALNKK